MSLADQNDINTFLPSDKIVVEDGDDDANLALLDSERIVIGQLATHIAPTTIASWDEPANTPDVIRAIVGRLSAALIYARKFSSQRNDVPDYAQMLYDQAMAMLQMIIAGTIDIGETVDTGFTDLRFWPNNTTDPPKFTMALEF